MTETPNRRPLKSRGTFWAEWLTKKLVATSITPNQISQASMVAAAISGLLFYLSSGATGLERASFLVGGAIFCQLRLLCNLMDGLVAVEGGKSAPDGAFWNEFPDRVADILIFVGFGAAVGDLTLGWAVASFAVLAAYIRELRAASGLEADFCGPMAKPHRMAAVTLGSLVAIFESLVTMSLSVIEVTLWIILVGTVFTCLRRAFRLITAMRDR